MAPYLINMDGSATDLCLLKSFRNMIIDRVPIAKLPRPHSLLLVRANGISDNTGDVTKAKLNRRILMSRSRDLLSDSRTPGAKLARTNGTHQILAITRLTTPFGAGAG